MPSNDERQKTRYKEWRREKRRQEAIERLRQEEIKRKEDFERLRKMTSEPLDLENAFSAPDPTPKQAIDAIRKEVHQYGKQ